MLLISLFTQNKNKERLIRELCFPTEDLVILKNGPRARDLNKLIVPEK